MIVLGPSVLYNIARCNIIATSLYRNRQIVERTGKLFFDERTDC